MSSREISCRISGRVGDVKGLLKRARHRAHPGAAAQEQRTVNIKQH
jgi:hypothetical protein